jgi:hypothetical protein
LTAVTLGALGLPPSDYASWIDHYATLRPDVICIVADPIGHLLAQSRFLPARRSAPFLTFGYSEILPLVLVEKGELRHSMPARLAGEALTYADGLFNAPDAQGRRSVDAPSYLGALETAIRAGLRTASLGVIVVTGPDATPESLDRRGVKDLLASTFAGAAVRVVDLGDDPAMRNMELRLNGFDFSAGGHAAAAERITPAMLGMLHLDDAGNQ